MESGSLPYAAIHFDSSTLEWHRSFPFAVGYRRFALGSVREEGQYLYSFTLVNFGSVGDIRRSNSFFRDNNLPPAY